MFSYRINVYAGLKLAIVGILLAYASVLTVLSLKMSPRTLLIGIDGRNTRVIREDTDALLEAEKIGFVIGFLETYYGFDAASFSEHAKESKRRMSPSLWKKKKDELDGIERRIKEEGLRQTYEVLALREKDKATYVADLKIRIERRGNVTEFPLRVELKLRKRERDAEIPYGVEVEVLDEKRMG